MDTTMSDIGDLHSEVQGSGARKNSGKLQMDLIPVRNWITHWSPQLQDYPGLLRLLTNLQEWQERGDVEALNSILTSASTFVMFSSVKVFEFGAKKYKAWNWAKGMPWSVPTGCILRHCEAILRGEYIDPDSDEEHIGHIICNVIMLIWYEDHYKEGDDRPPVYNNNKE
jgi:hypothetical protein